jgi:hypothetical protein
MDELRLGDQVASYDREATRAAYEALPYGGAERCGCVYCRNFATQRGSAYPKSFRELLLKMGIDPDKEGEVYDMMGPFEDRIRPTGGWFYFVGELLEKGEKLISDGDFKYWFQPSFPRPPACFGEHVAAIEFATNIPWVLKEDPGGGA